MTIYFSIKEVGVSLKQGSYLELMNPSNLEELAARTYVSMYFNISKSDTQQGRAFVFYMGNQVRSL